MDYSNPVGRRYFLTRLGVTTPVVALGVALLALAMWLRLALPFSGLLVLSAALALMLGLYTICDDLRFAGSMPGLVAIQENLVVGTYRSGGKGLNGAARRTIQFSKLDQLRPESPWRPGSKAGGGDWGSPAAALGQFDEPIDDLKVKIRQSRRDAGIGGGDPYDVIYLTNENYQRLIKAWDRWRTRTPEK